jgi:hypothetical protein
MRNPAEGTARTLRVFEHRHGKFSTAVTSNIDLRKWGRYPGDDTVAAAILDRLAMHGIRIDRWAQLSPARRGRARAGRTPRAAAPEAAEIP